MDGVPLRRVMFVGRGDFEDGIRGSVDKYTNCYRSIPPDNRFPWPRAYGIYMWTNSIGAYVGQSSNLLGRLIQHRKSGWDGAFFMQIAIRADRYSSNEHDGILDPLESWAIDRAVAAGVPLLNTAAGAWRPRGWAPPFPISWDPLALMAWDHTVAPLTRNTKPPGPH